MTRAERIEELKVATRSTFTSRCCKCEHNYDGFVGGCPRCGGFLGLYCSGGLDVAMRNRPSWLKVEMDGNTHCVKMDGFVNLQESPAGFGHNEVYASWDLIRQLAALEAEENDE